MPLLRRSTRHPVAVGTVALLVVVALLVAPSGAEEAVRVYPGMRYTVVDGSLCVLAYLFEGVVEVEPGEPAPPPEYYAVTAGHCGLAAGVRHATWGDGEGPVVTAPDQDMIPFGRFIFASERGLDGEDYDLGLIKLDPSAVLDPATCYWGGPTHLDTDLRTREGEMVSQVGHSQRLMNPRIGRGVDLAADLVLYQGTGVSGDSGGPVQASDGGALGIFSVTYGGSEHPEANNGASRLSAQLPRAEAAAGVHLALMTAPLAPVEWPFGAAGIERRC